MQRTIQISTPAHNGLYDITRQVEAIIQTDRIVILGAITVFISKVLNHNKKAIIIFRLFLICYSCTSVWQTSVS
jgi:thiamine phosphate synthase YjbQ (UPF0047 family)